MSEAEDTATGPVKWMEESIPQGDRVSPSNAPLSINTLISNPPQHSGVQQIPKNQALRSIPTLEGASGRLTSADEETAPAPPSLQQNLALKDEYATLVDSTPSIPSKPPSHPQSSGIRRTPKPSDSERNSLDPQIEETAPLSVSVLFPVPYWDRYEAVAPIGEGGMGTVYKARDPRLNRYVALKFIRGNDPRMVDRFFREAKAQARIDHPNVCKVFDVGEVDGHPYIAMEFVDGKPLDLAARKLGLEQKLRLIRDVALGLHAAHRIGLIHRDIKPANILVGQSSDGDLHPSVVDFGLARETNENEGQTMFGIQGTPAYMSPEQAAGDMRALDRRTDVYSLGATLYELLTGQPPFMGKNLYEMITRLSNDAPKPPRELDKRIPPDIEIIVLRCLEKEPTHRYDSAKAFADDLDRYLEGEPIHAKALSLWQQIRAKAKKNKTMTALIALSGFALMALVGVSIRGRMLADEQAELTREVGSIAQEFGQDVKEMELFMRYAYALPLHDTTREKAVVRERMRSIEEKMSAEGRRFGSLIEGPGHFALGKGYVALQEPEQALEHFSKAEGCGHQSADLYKELGKIHGVIYQKNLDRIQRIEDLDTRHRRQKELETQHLKPARQYLRLSALSDGTDTYTHALVAFYEEDFDKAYAISESAARKFPWLYEVKKLQGDIFYARASLYSEDGHTEEALSQYAQAITCYRDASEMATSDPSVYEAAAETWIRRMQVEDHRGLDITSSFRSAALNCEQALTADPQRGSVFAAKALALVFYGQQLDSQNRDSRETFETAIEAGKKSIEYEGPNAEAYRAIGLSFWLIANREISISDDATWSLDQAIQNLQQALAINSQSSWLWNDLGIIYGTRADSAAANGDDPRIDLEHAVQSFERSAEINPFNFAPSVNIGWFQAQIALYGLDHGESVLEHLVDAFSSLDLVISTDKNYFQAWNNLGLAHGLMARYEADMGEDPSSSLDRAMSAFDMASALSPEDAESKQGKVNILLAKANCALKQNQSPLSHLDEAGRILEGLLHVQPDDVQNLLAHAEYQKLLGEFAAKNKKPADKFFEAAERSLRKPMSKGAANLHLLRALAGLYETRAQMALVQKKSPRKYVREGLLAIAQAKAKNPNLPALDAMEGALYLAEAEAEKDGDKQKKSAALADSAIRKALGDNYFLRRAYEPLLMRAKGYSSGVHVP